MAGSRRAVKKRPAAILVIASLNWIWLKGFRPAAHSCIKLDSSRPNSVSLQALPDGAC